MIIKIFSNEILRPPTLSARRMSKKKKKSRENGKEKIKSQSVVSDLDLKEDGKIKIISTNTMRARTAATFVNFQIPTFFLFDISRVGIRLFIINISRTSGRVFDKPETRKISIILERKTDIFSSEIFLVEKNGFLW